MKVENDAGYINGLRAAKDIIRFVANTSYGTIDVAIRVKGELVDHFVDDFGYSREMDTFDWNYSYNLGILDGLKAECKKQGCDGK